MLDAQRLDPVTANAAEPAERRRMAVDDSDDAAVARQGRKQLFDMAQMLHAAVVAAQSSCTGPASMEPVSGSNREQSDVTSALADEARGFDRFRRDRAGI